MVDVTFGWTEAGAENPYKMPTTDDERMLTTERDGLGRLHGLAG
jgi:hypothetical protein